MKILIFQAILLFLLSEGRAEYYEGLREFYRRVDQAYGIPILPGTAPESADNYCVTIEKSEKVTRGIYLNPSACDESNSHSHCRGWSGVLRERELHWNLPAEDQLPRAENWISRGRVYQRLRLFVWPENVRTQWGVSRLSLIHICRCRRAI
eukprot:TRINITY_DN14153_c0_g1_i1.p1 TRINITY_DN14153_c0_g1~~TRINITY_DN14153_c0_g1_i1.p1  ORF type:complete len:163 (+),score=21.06 TRINITY_DN14153_c0_g1_i1:37-489(+)